MLSTDLLHAGHIPYNLDERLPLVPFLKDIPDVAGRDLLGERDGDGMVDALEPGCDVRDESYLPTQLRRHLPLVDVVCQAVRDDVVSQVLHVVLWARFGARSGVAGHAKDCRVSCWRDVVEKWGDSELGGGGVAAWVGNEAGGCNGTATSEFRKTVCPLGVEAVVSAQIYDEWLAAIGGSGS